MQDERLAAEAFRVAMFVQTEQLRHAGRIQIGHVAKINDDVGLAGQALEFVAPSLPTTYVVFTQKAIRSVRKTLPSSEAPLLYL